MLVYTDEYVSDLNKIQTVIPNLEKLFGKTVLVTGANGLICSAVIDFFSELNSSKDANISIYAAGRNKSKIMARFLDRIENSHFHFFQYDALKEFSTDIKCDYIIHGASNAHPAAFINEPVETMVANLYGIKNILDYMKISKAERLLYISSSEVYGKKKEQTAYKETDYGFVDILNPRACYPSSKRAAETLCSAYRKEYGIDAVIVRPGHVYGPTVTDNDSRASSQFARDVKMGKNIVMKSAGLQLRSYCYVLDCVSAIITVLLNGKSGEAYNISNTDSVVTLREMVEKYSKAANQNVVFEKATEIEKSGYNLMDNSSLNSEKLEALGWKGIFDIQTGIEKTLEAMD